MRGLCFRVGLSHAWARFAETKAQLAKESLTLPRFEIDLQFLIQKSRERLTIPNSTALDAGFTRSLAQSDLHLHQLIGIQACRAARTFSFGEARKPGFIEAMNPVFNRPRRVSQNPSSLTAAEALGNQQDPVQAVIVSRFLGTADFVLQNHYRGLGVSNLKCFHPSIKPHLQSMRNYL